jgi:hypothetical protein
MHLGSLLVGAIVATLATAHPGDDVSKEIAERREFLLNNPNDLSHCAEKMRARGVHSRNIERRSKIAEGLLQERGLEGWLRYVLKGPSQFNILNSSSTQHPAQQVPQVI